jgi:hypothetical protein
MATKRHWKVRILRKIVKWKEKLILVMGLICLIGLVDGVYRIGYWGVYCAKYCYHAYVLDDLCSVYNYSKRIGPELYFYENGPFGYIENFRTDKKVLRDVNWVAGIDNEGDTLLCYASHGYRGYLNRNTGETPIPADRYIKGWLFSEGVAAVVDKDSTVKFINPSGDVVLDKHFQYTTPPANRGILFKNGYCPMSGRNHLWGLIDRRGNWVINPGYEEIASADKNYWIVKKNGMCGLLNDSLKSVITPQYREIVVQERGVEILDQDYTRKLLDFNGKIMEDFVYTNIRGLLYKVDVVALDTGDYEWVVSPYMEYQTTRSSDPIVRVGLLDPDGKPVTPPLYTCIVAVNSEYFRCFYDKTDCYDEEEGLSVLINKKGQVINSLK